MITPLKLNMAGSSVAIALLVITARQNIFYTILPQTWHYYTLKIADIIHGNRAEYFWHFYALPCPITLRHKDVKKTGVVIIWSTATKLNELNKKWRWNVNVEDLTWSLWTHFTCVFLSIKSATPGGVSVNEFDVRKYFYVK